MKQQPKKGPRRKSIGARQKRRMIDAALRRLWLDVMAVKPEAEQ